MLSRRTIMFLSVAALAVMAPVFAIADEAWPTKTLTIIVPYPPGGLTDVVTRPMAAKLSKLLGKTVIVVNQPGAGGKVGLQAMLKAPHDGHTIGTVVPATMVSLPLTDKSYGIDPLKEFTPLTIAVDTFMVLMANADAGKTLKDFTANARTNPGKFNYGTLGAGTSYHFYSVILAKELGLNAVHVVYKGDSNALNDLAGGQIQFLLTSAAAGRAYIDSGKAVPLAVTGTDRIASLPHIPTLREQGVDLVTEGWVGYVVPADVPAPAAKKLEAAMREAINDPDVRKIYSNIGYTVRGSSGEEFRTTVEANLNRFGKLIKDGDIQLAE
ncbi:MULTISPECIES: tripartite tricarboxylate transporter substrate binding protein [unclassified Beijerinckia]|uniref:Bug family tripartite tricarboxylate transporter substrate binding protein n=1 Tax=unclassified Beijerinckia TaxID=2638183 RepID=UPI00089B27FA|nr:MULTISPECIES: tripartite tricarboxylate transporter substrate binding protein [unclassified Beijerinckia]MDH7794647.1 tripartite-type tricarboxylate transporter receptor subunit TctC [Beijerinckia sp. GAS462]SEB69776.1 Tripartite-type tricarboxylate transporter, receptor component TctC [Beijerinckia sp. 28-YEA-48]